MPNWFQPDSKVNKLRLQFLSQPFDFNNPIKSYENPAIFRVMVSVQPNITMETGDIEV